MEPASTESYFYITIKFVNSSSGGTFFDGVSLASSWESCKDLKFVDWTRRREQDYSTRLSRESLFGKTLFLLDLTKGVVRVEKDHPFRPLFYGRDLMYIRDRWKRTLQRRSYNARNSAHGVAGSFVLSLNRLSYQSLSISHGIARSLALSPWMFIFVVDSLIYRAYKLLGSMKRHIEKHLKKYALGGATVLSLNLYLFYAPWRRLQNLIQTISSPEAFRCVRISCSDFVLFYICCQLLPSELLEAILEKKWKQLVSVSLGLALRTVVTGKGADLAIVLG